MHRKTLPDWQTGWWYLAGGSKAHHAISKILFPWDIYTIVEKNDFVRGIFHFSTLCNLTSFTVH